MNPLTSYSTEAYEAGIPTLMFGPLGGDFHAPGEWVAVSETVAVAEIVERAVMSFCG